MFLPFHQFYTLQFTQNLSFALFLKGSIDNFFLKIGVFDLCLSLFRLCNVGQAYSLNLFSP